MNVRNFIAQHFSQFTSSTISTIQPLSGGDINDVYKIDSSSGSFVVKINSSSRFPEMFQKEAKGLQLLGQCDAIEVPEVVYFNDSSDQQILVMTFIERGQASDFQTGEGLAALHQISNENYGLDHDNYIGSLLQYNKPNKNWIDFLFERRWQKQLDMMSASSRNSLEKDLHQIKEKLPNMLEVKKPSLLHGDLWSGNYFPGQKRPVLYDPAVYFGDPIVDLAMMELFGSISSATADAYLQNSDIQSDWQSLIPLYQIYPLMVHVNLFGSSYLGSAKRAINTYL